MYQVLDYYSLVLNFRLYSGFSYFSGSSGFSSAAATTPGATSSSTPPIISGTAANVGLTSNLTGTSTGKSIFQFDTEGRIRV